MDELEKSNGLDKKAADDALLKGCLFKILKFLGVLGVIFLFAFLLADKYKLGVKAYEKGYWESAVSFFKDVKPKDEHYKDAQEKLRIAEENLKLQQNNQSTR